MRDRALNAAYLEWKYESNPYVKEPLIYLAMNQGRAVGMRGAFATKWQIGNRDHTFLIPYPDDFVIDPENRNQGLMTRIMKFAINDLGERGFDHALVRDVAGHRVHVRKFLRKAIDELR